MWIDDPILRERSCRARALRWCKCLTPVLSSGNEGEALHQPFSFSLTFCIASNTFKSCVFTCASRDEKKNSQVVLSGWRWVFLWDGYVRGACFPTNLQGIPLSSLSFCCKPASPHRWWTSLFGRCSYTWRLLLPTAMRLSGQNASKSAGEHYISHYLRTIGHFLLAVGQRGWSGAAKLQEGSTDCRRSWRLKGAAVWSWWIVR